MLNLEIVTPEKNVVNETVEAVTLPGREGEIGVLPGHAALISGLKPGILSYTKSGATSKMVVSGGFVEISSDRVSVLADAAETVDQIDANEARAERDRVSAGMGNLSGEELDDALDQIDRAEARLQLAAGR